MKPLILCADDFAVNAAVSQGIAALARAGRISATSALVLSPRWAADAALLGEVRGRIDLGLHLDWTSPFARAAGHGVSLLSAMRRAALGGFCPLSARRVIDRQLDAFEAVWKAPPDHIDGHQHVQQFAGIRQALVMALQQRYGRQSPVYLRLSVGVRADRCLKTRVIASLGAGALARLAGTAGIGCTPALSGIYNFNGGAARYAQQMTRWLHNAPVGCLVMCHPATQAEADDEIGRARAWEYAYLASDAFSAALAQANVRLCQGAQLHFPRD